MNEPLFVMIFTFILLLIMNVPIAVTIGLSTFWAISSIGEISGINVVAPRLATGINSFSLLAIPFFILMGLFLGKGGIARKLIDLAEALVGRFPGGLAFVNTLGCMLMGAISGSSVAAVSSIGGVMIPEMTKKGYDKNFNIALTSCSATTGLLIPPSNPMIVYALVTGTVSIAALFLAGVFPGILVGFSLMIVSAIIAKKHKYVSGERIPLKETIKRFFSALPGLLLIIIVIGGIITGIFTPTEAAGIAVVYAFILAVIVYKEVKWKEIPGILLECGVTSSVVMFLIGTSTGMSWFMASQDIPEYVGKAILSISTNKFAILLMINILFLFVGTFLDMTPAILIFTPIFLPIIQQLGINLVHFGIIIIANLCIGLCTPPVGTVLFLGVSVGKGKIHEVIRSFLPFFAFMIISLLLITYIPGISLLLPKLFGL
ncbi:MAG: TRAP transporter large permease [candidate division WOR-3 bacterium]